MTTEAAIAEFNRGTARARDAEAAATPARKATPGRDSSPVRHVRVNDAVWDHATAKAEREGRKLAEVVRALLIDWSGFDTDDTDR
jgi:hypothetical protein